MPQNERKTDSGSEFHRTGPRTIRSGRNIVFVCSSIHRIIIHPHCWIKSWLYKGLCKEKKCKKIWDYYGSGWVGPGLTRKILCGKLSQNSPKPGLIFCSSTYYVCTLLKVVGYSIMIWVFCPCQWWVSKKTKFGWGGWVGGVSSIQFFLDFWNFFTLQSP